MKTKYAKTENYYVLLNTQIPAVLVEMGFLSNYSESQKLLNDDYQEILAQRMAEGIFNKIKEALPFLKGGPYGIKKTQYTKETHPV